MTKDQLKAKYGRIANDPSQLEMFKNDVIDGKAGGELPDAPTEAGTFVLTSEDGVISWSEGSGPTPTEPVGKGDTILIAGKAYLVLEANEDNTLVKLMPLTEYLVSNWWNLGYVQTTSFELEDSESTYTGLKYEGSNLDQACSAWIETLDQSLQDALVEAEFVQDMMRIGYSVDNPDFEYATLRGETYRVKKFGHSPTTLLRKAHVISMSEIIEFFNSDFTAPKLDLLCCGFTSSASGFTSGNAYFIEPANGTSDMTAQSQLIARPVINVNLTLVDYIK